MSFQSKGLWTSNDGRCLNGEEIDYDSLSRVEPKRSHQLFIDGESALFPSKKQAINICCSNSFGGIPAPSLSPWGSLQGFDPVPGQLTEQVFDANRDTSFDEGNTSSVNVGSLKMGRKVIDVPFESNASFGLSMSNPLGGPKSGINYGGIRKVKVSEVRDPENLMAISMGPSYSRGTSEGLTYGQEEGNVVSLGDSYGREDDNYVSISQSYTKDACNLSTMGNPYKLSNRNSFNGEDYSIMPMAGNFSKGNDNGIISLSHTYECDRSIRVAHDYNKGDNLTASISPSNSKCESHMLSMGHSFDKGDSNIISFGSHNNVGYDLLIGAPSGQRCNTVSQKDLTLPNGDAGIVATKIIASRVECTSKKKEDTKPMKKTPPNNFPSNVRSLLSTGILDEVPVKYIAWSREFYTYAC